MIPLVCLLAIHIHASLPPGWGIEVSDLMQGGIVGSIRTARTFRGANEPRELL
jgi:hypothetical protein